MAKVAYRFFRRYSTRPAAEAKAKKLRKEGLKAKVVALKGHEKHNFDVMIS